jgi:hypothetical protein
VAEASQTASRHPRSREGLMIDLTRNGEVFTLTVNAGEIRWNTTFVRAIFP